jgi:predicted O-methyltransferase YrrM
MKFTQAEIYAMVDNLGLSLNEDIIQYIEEPYLKELRIEDRGIIGHDNLYYTMFYELSLHYRPALVVELGSWRAFGAAHFAAGNPVGKVITIDIHKDDKVAQQRTIAIAAHYPNMQYINKWTWDAAGDVEASGLPIDILFIDAWHEYQYARREWDLYKPLLADDALIICDDIFDSVGTTDNMVQLWTELDKSQGIRWKFLDTKLHYPVPMGFASFHRKYIHANAK